MRSWTAFVVKLPVSMCICLRNRCLNKCIQSFPTQMMIASIWLCYLYHLSKKPSRKLSAFYLCFRVIDSVYFHGFVVKWKTVASACLHAMRYFLILMWFNMSLCHTFKAEKYSHFTALENEKCDNWSGKLRVSRIWFGTFQFTFAFWKSPVAQAA